jgi:hypothetical protein
MHELRAEIARLRAELVDERRHQAELLMQLADALGVPHVRDIRELPTRLDVGPMVGYHVTTFKRMNRYRQTGGILPPVRFWPNLYLARQWQERTGRLVILKIQFRQTFPLPDHRPARWSPDCVTEWEVV